MKTAPHGTPSTRKRTLKIGAAQIELLRLISTYEKGINFNLLVTDSKERAGAVDRMLQGLIKRGYVTWEKPEGLAMAYKITGLGMGYLRDLS